MNEKVENGISMKRYLLGDLAGDEQQQLEERLMTSDEFLEQLLIAEEELIDEYLRGALAAREEMRFHDHFLCTPERQQKLKFARALQRYVRVQKPQVVALPSFWESLVAFMRVQNPAIGYCLAAALLLVVVGGVWSTFNTLQLKNELDGIRARQSEPARRTQELERLLAEQRTRHDQLLEELQRQERSRLSLEQELAVLRSQQGTGAGTGTSPQWQRPTMLSVALMPGLLRDMGGMARVTIPSGTTLVELQLGLPSDDYNRYRAELQNAGGEEIWSQSAKARDARGGEAVRVIVPARLLGRGDYSVKLSGVSTGGASEDLAKFYFRVATK
jgi:hypothetical protein